MAKNDVRTKIIERLENFSDEHDLKSVWSIERRPDGCMTVQLKHSDGRSFTQRITSGDIFAANNDADVIVENIIEMVKSGLEL